jgi:hypothetical protein
MLNFIEKMCKYGFVSAQYLPYWGQEEQYLRGAPALT